MGKKKTKKRAVTLPPSAPRLPGEASAAKQAEARLLRGLAQFNRRFKFHQAIRKKGVESFKDKTHPQMWRVNRHGGIGARLGPMGALGEDVILEVTFLDTRIPPAQRGLFKSLFTQIESTFTGDVHDPLAAYMIGKIETWVPMDTGRLRNSMRSVVEASGGSVEGMRRGATYRMTLGTPSYQNRSVTYASVVNKMPTAWLRHPGNHRNVSYRKRVKGKPAPLDDPEARTKFYDLIVVNSRNLAQRLWKEYLDNQIVPRIKDVAKAAGIKNPHAFARSLFTVAFK